MLPSKIRIGCFDYDVIETDEVLLINNRACKGTISYDKHVIKLSKDDLSEQSKEQTLWHEIVHGIINYRKIDIQKADLETAVDELAIGLYGLCKSNGLLPGQKVEKE